MKKARVRSLMSFLTGAVLSLAFGLPALVRAQSNDWNAYVYRYDETFPTTNWNFDIILVNAYQDGTNWITYTNLIIRATTNAAIDNHPDLSPDGQWVVWSSTRGNGDFDLYLGDFTNVEATARRLTDDTYTNGPQTRYPDRHCHFRSDGRTIIFSSKNRMLDHPIEVVSECSQPKIITPPRFYEGLNIISLTSTGTVAGYRELDIRNAWDSTTYPGIWTNSSGTYAGHPSFSPDGANIVFSGSIDGEGKVWEVYTMGYNAATTNLVSNSLRRRTFGPAVGRNPVQMSGGAHYTADGTNILFSTTRTSGGNSLICQIPSDAIDIPIPSATQLTSHNGNDYVPEPLSNGYFVVTTDLGTNSLCGGSGEGPTADLDLVIVSSDGSTRTAMLADPNRDEMALIADEVSWFCGLPPNMKSCTYMPRVYAIESLYLEKSGWLYLQGYIASPYLPSDLLDGFGYADKALYMYSAAWQNMEAFMTSKNPSYLAQIMAYLQQMHSCFATFPGLNDEAALETWMQVNDTIRNTKVVMPSVMYADRGIGTRWVSVWSNQTGGYFSDPTNWNFGIPRSNDIARFSTGTPDTVVVRLTNQLDVGAIEVEMVQLELVGTNPIFVRGPITVGGSTGITATSTNLVLSNITASAEDIIISNNAQVYIGDSFFDIRYDIVVTNNGSLLHVSGGQLSADTLRVSAGAELRGSGEIDGGIYNFDVNLALVSGRISPGNSVGTMTLSSNVVFQSGEFACDALSDTNLDKIIAAGKVSGTGTVVMTAAADAAPVNQVIIDGSDDSDYSNFTVTPTADWRLVTLAGGKLAVTKTGAGRADPAMVTANGNWYFRFSGQGYAQSGPYPLGVSGAPVTGDFDSDGKDDPAMVDSAGNWYLWLSGQSYAPGGPYPLGVSGAPVAADFDDDDKDDPVMVTASGNWYLWLSRQGYAQSGPYPLGVSGTPVTGDFDDDDKDDPVMVTANGNWYIWFSGQGYAQSGPYPLGVSGIPVAADFDGDGKDDPAMVSSNGNWYLWLSGQGYAQSGPYPLGMTGTPVAGDFDGQ